MNAEKYIKVVKKKVAPDFANAFPDGSGVYQQDSVPCHKAKKVMDYMKKMKITVLDSPGNSRVANRPGMAGTVPELTSGVSCPGLGHFCLGSY